MGIGWPQILIIVVLLVLLFGRGKISGLMGDVAQGIKSFKKGIAEDDDEPEDEAPKNLEKKSDTVVSEEKTEKSDSAS
ncbi:MAG: twin-arginine translocase TatA/TatE family subunit [Kordiimonadaceae bacterium]|jgi:sec-independent protein translocase protein TatA|nr:twin-arginine translocase TatA/TatE family subunit [Kordiimonadaceae bacterium]MBT6036242.1 twin-arginine translocase TatA/TatE family subunit [Kordiimonadaceae bacterium]MBT6330592.1 twin-arginine translocase TatA/TatE family subunit [Kordiimonadaceae bacterium]MBT7583872.1 twin-arginine translocase TatA/TatE family subunit [Kordiimonadaceae bacterium]